MRIRKRWPTPSAPPPPPPPLESFHHHQSPSDPPVQPPLTVPAPPRPDLQLTLVKGTNGWICKTDEDCMHPNSSSTTQVGEEALPNNSKIAKLSITAAVHANKDIRLGAKDRDRISCSASASHLEIESATKTTKTNMKREIVEDISSGMMSKKREKVDKDGAMTEGSGCSRVNGRGWRCWKQTVEGHSLCAHHSTQGRLSRSTTSFKDEKQGHTAIVLLDEEPLIMLKKRKKKIGMVKNRSISGLLAQTEPQPAPPMPMLDSVAFS